MECLRGVYWVLATPFRPDGALDDRSLRRLLEWATERELTGLTILGVAGEAGKLLPDERDLVVSTVMEVCQERLRVVVGTTQNGTAATIHECRRAEAAGASAVMVAPPLFSSPGSALTEHFRAIGEAISIPIVLQDYPPTNGVTMSPTAMAGLVEGAPAIRTIKLEDTPTPQRTAEVLRSAEGITVLGGLGGVYLLDELRRGSDGAMTGFGYPEVLVEIWDAWNSGNRDDAAAIYHRYLPLLVFEGQPKIGLAVRKRILMQRGLIDHDFVRAPGPRLDDELLVDLSETVEMTGAAERFDATASR